MAGTVTMTSPCGVSLTQSLSKMSSLGIWPENAGCRRQTDQRLSAGSCRSTFLNDFPELISIIKKGHNRLQSLCLFWNSLECVVGVMIATAQYLGVYTLQMRPCS